jgi:hypothetical protein
MVADKGALKGAENEMAMQIVRDTEQKLKGKAHVVR